jgi:hypothetical protein
MKTKVWVALLAAVFVLGIELGLVLMYDPSEPTYCEVVRTDTIVRVDTMMILPEVTDSVVVRYETRLVPLAGTDSAVCAVTGDTATAGHTTMWAHSSGGLSYSQDSVMKPPDSALVRLEITQKVYATDRYRAWVSGYDPKLDSLELYDRETVVERETCVTRKRRRWGCVIGGGVGAGEKGIGPYVGVTIGYVLF